MFGIGLPELILILVVALIIIGPKKLPDVAKALGRAAGEFRRATSDFKEAIDLDDDLRDLKNVKDSISDIKEDVRSTLSFDDITNGLSSKEGTEANHSDHTSDKSEDAIGSAGDVPAETKPSENNTPDDSPPVDQKEPDPNARG